MTLPAQQLKVILVGDSGVGKTAIARRYCNMGFTYDMVMTVGVSHLQKLIHIDGCDVELKLWDTAGSEDYAPLVPLYIRGAHFAIVTASIVDRCSIEHLRKWKEAVIEIEPHCVIVLAINKMDMEENADVRTQLTEEMQGLFPLIYFTSAKTGEEIDNMFDVAATQALKPQMAQRSSIGVEGQGQHHGCC
jgi:small GTP-binding protein